MLTILSIINPYISSNRVILPFLISESQFMIAWEQNTVSDYTGYSLYNISMIPMEQAGLGMSLVIIGPPPPSNKVRIICSF